ncbi:glycosyl transferase-like UDP-glucuronosyltransferase [Novosphingobium sp.]|uniref:glycosyl transferase-like UDP-glucuronosyltransferase n=1 Tax=Novosphingobium sp. TaxID=1874826 RepID=UPI002609B48D|nr:glycosyl transferase-like UDP-glucuronosyltransferase [Novosphingobium sp.]
MAHILLGWELGGNSGHVRRLAGLARRLLAQGHTLTLAVQRPDALRVARDLEGRVAIRQAPVWPGLWRHGGAQPAGSPASFGDVLGNLGLTDSGVAEYLLRAWDGLLADAGPALVVGDFAPLLLLAARGRIPRVAVGTGFTVPPADGPSFPAFVPGTAPRFDEAQLLAVAERALEHLRWPALERLPALMGAEAALPGVFDLLDPYQGRRSEPLLPPFLSRDPGLAGEGDAVFAYLPGLSTGSVAAEALLAAARAGLKVGLHAPGMADADAAALAGGGVGLLAQPLPMDAITRQARVLVCAGGQGMVSAALAAGLPLVVAPGSIEQELTIAALARAGLGRELRDASDVVDAAQDRSAAARALAARSHSVVTAGAYEDAALRAIGQLLT